MAEIVTLELPETLAQRAKEIAALTKRRIEDVLGHVRVARDHCGYCLSPQHLVMARLEIEHIISLGKR
jgi:hypothetical protein